MKLVCRVGGFARELEYEYKPVRRFHSSIKLAVLLSFLLLPVWSQAATVSGTVKDPSGAVIADARIEITGGNLPQAVVLTSDGLGKFVSPDLQPGSYQVRVTRNGFAPLEKTIDVSADVDLQLTLAIAQQQTKIEVPGQALAFANSDPVYVSEMAGCASGKRESQAI